MHPLTKHYTCKFCSICLLPMIKHTQCKICSIEFHIECFSSAHHKCTSCKYCKGSGCIKEMEEKTQRRIKIFKAQTKENTQFNFIDSKLRHRTISDFVETQRSGPKNKIEQIRDTIGKEFRIHTFEIKNKGSFSEILTLYTNLFTVTHFMHQLFYINRCQVCLSGFHTSEPERYTCIECSNCYNCGKRTLLKDEYTVIPMNSMERGAISIQNILYCTDCHDGYLLKNMLCPICNKGYTQEEMVECEWCLRWIHYTCEPNKDLLESIITETLKMLYKCQTCEFYENYWVGRTPSIPNAKNKANEKQDFFDLTDLKLTHPECFLCPRVFTDVESEIVKLMPINGRSAVYYAHNICVASCSRKKGNKMLVQVSGHKCKKCKKPNATFKCIYCENKYYHFDCAFQDSNDLFRSNVVLPICTEHYCENLDIIPIGIQLYLNAEYYTDQSENVKYLQFCDFLIHENGTFERLIYGLENAFVLKCDFRDFYLNNKKMSCIDVGFTLKENGYNLKIEDVVFEALRLREENSKVFQNKFKHPQSLIYNPCVDVKHQLMNFTTSFISHNISTNRFEIGDSAIHGKGVFATRFFFPNEVLINYTGESIDHKDANDREKKYKDLDCYLFKTGSNVIDATFKGNLAKFINQSCAPNCYSTEATWGSKTGIVICSKTFISVGEELTYKYGFNGKRMVCRCMSMNCKSRDN